MGKGSDLDYGAILKSWRTVTKFLHSDKDAMDEEIVKALLRGEFHGARRASIIGVLHSRYHKLRGQRIRKMLVNGHWPDDNL